MRIRWPGAEGSAALAARWARVLEWDRACAVGMHRRLSPRYTKLWLFTDHLGYPGPWLLFIFAVGAFGGALGQQSAFHMLAVGTCGAVLYKLVKEYACRARPCVNLQGVRQGAEPLDEFSFPSGHTLHAVAFATVATYYFPQLGFGLFPFALLTAVSRIALGLHYPSDVLAGASIGMTIALLSFAFI